MALAAANLSVDTVAAETPDVADLLEGLPKNWNRWGPDDELGALNLLGSEAAFDGMEAATRSGRENVATIPLQLSITGESIATTDGEATLATGDPQFPGRTAARRHNTQDEESYRNGEEQPMTGLKYADDKFIDELFLQGTTHADALGHTWYGDRIYNGFDAETTAERKRFDDPSSDCGDDRFETRGLGKADVTHAAERGVVGRGVLLDVGRVRGGSDDRLALGECVTLSDLRATANAQQVELRPNDILLIRTGSIARTRDPTAPWDPLDEPGLCFSEELVRWVHEMDIPFIGADNLAVERMIQEVDGETYVAPLHPAFLRNLGVTLCEIMWLEDLADQAASDGIYDFLFAGAPLNVERATGAPMNPVAIKATGD